MAQQHGAVVVAADAHRGGGEGRVLPKHLVGHQPRQSG